MRVHELAKELGLNSKALIVKLEEMEIPVKSHMSALEKDQVDRVVKALKRKEPKKPPKKGSKKTAEAFVKEQPEEEVHETVKETTNVEEGTREVLVERRLSRTVIRRRKRTEKEPPPPPVQEEQDEAQAEAVAEAEELDKKAKKAKAPAKGKAKDVADKESEAVAETEPEAADKEGAVAAKEKKTDKKKAQAEETDEQRVESGEAVQEGVEKLPAAGGERKAEPRAASASKTAAAEKSPAKKPVKKPKAPARDGSVARIVDRIELKIEKKPEKSPAAAEGNKDAVAAPAPEKKEGTGEAIFDKDAKGGFKDKKKRKKFNWQKENIFGDEAEKTAAPHRRVRLKIKDKKGGRKGQLQAEVIQFGQRKKVALAPEKTVPKAIKRKIRLHEGITVAELAKRMGVKATQVIKKLIDLGEMATINQFLDIDTASLVSAEFGYEIESISLEEETIFEQETSDSEQDLQSRSPVVTVMGHVDHGKTSLLDAIRKTNVTGGEKGGITQHIGAYRVSLKEGTMTFVDTPGHEAFTTMRARGAKVTDIVILVVAAEEGVKPQTVEAINHAKAAEVPIIVAINKIDKPEANPDKVKQELSNYGLLQEDWGGDTIFVEVSAKTEQGIDKLLEMVLLQAEMLELKSNPNKQAKGTIVEARLDKSRGPIATVLVQEGTLRVGDSFISKYHFGKVRAMIDDRGKTVQEAGPAMPVEVLGFSGVPEAGDVFIAVDEKKARQTSMYWQQRKREEELRKDARVSLENFLENVSQEDTKELRIIIKSDVQGSAEALQQSLEQLSTDEVKVTILHSSVGAVSLNDIMLASASNAIIVGFGVKLEPKVMETAGQEKVECRMYGVIYEVIDDVRKAMLGMLAPEIVEKFAGKAEIKEVFNISKYGTVAGCMVMEGKVVKGSKARVVRDAQVVHEGEISSLKRYKDDAKEVPSGQDCGIFLGSYKEFEVGDIIESFFVEKVDRTAL